jgi:hypothetical protein
MNLMRIMPTKGKGKSSQPYARALFFGIFLHDFPFFVSQRCTKTAPEGAFPATLIL